MNIGFISYLFTFVAFFAFITLMVISWRGKSLGTLIIIASVLSLIWSGVVVLVNLGAAIPIEILEFFELSRSLSWCLFLVVAVQKQTGKETKRSVLFKMGIVLSFLLILLAAIVVSPLAVDYVKIFSSSLRDVIYILSVAIAVAGMALVEQFFRNSDETQRWATKFLCLGLGSIFAYDFFMYADALLLKRISLSIWQARGFVNAMAVPLIAISVARNPKYELDIHVSRKVVFHTATLMGASVYLLVMSVAGYFIRFYGGTWGSVLQVVFLAGAAVLLLVLMFSDKIRAKIRVLLSKHFFSYKYDYREQWQQFSLNLASQDGTVTARIIGAIASLVDSPSGALWEKSTAGQYVLLDRLHMPEPEPLDKQASENIDTFFEHTNWVVDFDEYIDSPSRYKELQLPTQLLNIPNAWLIIPLVFKDKCIGFVLLKRTKLPITINWEDRDLLKMAGRQAASHLAQFQADRALARSQQFEAFNRLSAYVVHDLKNILAQQSLIVANAEKHKHNPLFIDDVLSTVQNSVGRMTRLMEQMRSGERGNSETEFELGKLIKKVVESASNRQPKPNFLPLESDVNVIADKEQMTTVFAHILQNAQDATDKTGKIEVRVRFDEQKHVLVEIEDSGIGMEEDFINNRLFKPFDSTKGLTGMGVGAFESREYIRSIGGDIYVTSKPGKGSVFKIVLPYNRLVFDAEN